MISNEISIKGNLELNQNITICYYTNIKSIYILQKFFGNLPQKKSLEICKYNKNIQQRLNLCINNYKKFCESYSSIIIDIIPVTYDYGVFINFNEEDEKYYHIYFNNSKEEIKRKYIKNHEKVNNINIKINYQVESFYKLFYDCKCIKSIYFKQFLRNNINNMSKMFANCLSIKEIDFSNCNTSNVENMSEMFDACSSLEVINISNFNTEKVKNMSSMFNDCKLLKQIDLSNFNTNEVIDMNCMFCKCNSLKKINLSSFNTNNVRNMKGMFFECYSLEDLDISNFNVNNGTDRTQMFEGCNEEMIKKINI